MFIYTIGRIPEVTQTMVFFIDNLTLLCDQDTPIEIAAKKH